MIGQTDGNETVMLLLAIETGYNSGDWGLLVLESRHLSDSISPLASLDPWLYESQAVQVYHWLIASFLGTKRKFERWSPPDLVGLHLSPVSLSLSVSLLIPRFAGPERAVSVGKQTLELAKPPETTGNPTVPRDLVCNTAQFSINFYSASMQSCYYVPVYWGQQCI